MAITIDQVAHALREQDLKFAKVSDHEILFLLGVGPVKLKMVLQLMEDGEYLDVSAMDLGTCPKDHPRLEAVLEKLAHVNYQYKAVKFSWDPKDGEIRIRIAIPLEDNPELPTSQLRNVIEFIAVIAGRVWPEIEELVGKQEGAETKPARRPAEGRSQPSAPALRQAQGGMSPSNAATPRRGDTTRHDVPKRRSSSPAMMVLAVGVLLLGVAAVAAVVYRLFIH